MCLFFVAFPVVVLVALDLYPVPGLVLCQCPVGLVHCQSPVRRLVPRSVLPLVLPVPVFPRQLESVLSPVAEFLRQLEPVLSRAAPDHASLRVIPMSRLVLPQPPLLWSPGGFFVRSPPVLSLACAT